MDFCLQLANILEAIRTVSYVPTTLNMEDPTAASPYPTLYLKGYNISASYIVKKEASSRENYYERKMPETKETDSSQVQEKPTEIGDTIADSIVDVGVTIDLTISTTMPIPIRLFFYGSHKSMQHQLTVF